MEMLSVSLNLRDRLVLVVGGGKVAAKRIARILAAGGSLTLVAEDLDESVRAVIESAVLRDEEEAPDAARRPARLAAACTLHEQSWAEFSATSSVPARDYALVCACTDDESVNDAVAAFGERAGVFVNRADIGRESSLHFAAESRVGEVRVSISTGGHAPVVSRAMREVLEVAVLPHWARRVREVAALRPRAKSLPEGRKRRFWASLRRRLVETRGEDEGFAEFASRLLETL